MEKNLNSNYSKIIKTLIDMYPNVTGSLNYSSPFELLVCLILAAQCTDKRVNEVTKNIFIKYSTPKDFANIPLDTLEELIHPCGFYRNKAKNIIKASTQILKKYNGIVPNNIDELQTIAGIGRKSANCIMSDAFHNPQGVAIDTHAKRICTRLNLSNEAEPNKIEKDILKNVNKKYWKDLNLIFVTHGREICCAQNPKCNICQLHDYCNYYKKNNHNIN